MTYKTCYCRTCFIYVRLFTTRLNFHDPPVSCHCHSLTTVREQQYGRGSDEQKLFFRRLKLGDELEVKDEKIQTL